MFFQPIALLWMLLQLEVEEGGASCDGGDVEEDGLAGAGDGVQSDGSVGGGDDLNGLLPE